MSRGLKASEWIGAGLEPLLKEYTLLAYIRTQQCVSEITLDSSSAWDGPYNPCE